MYLAMEEGQTRGSGWLQLTSTGTVTSARVSMMEAAWLGDSWRLLRSTSRWHSPSLVAALLLLNSTRGCLQS